MDAENKAYLANQATDSSGRSSLEQEIASLERSVQDKQQAISLMESDIKEYEGLVAQYRMEYLAVSGTQFDQPDTCPTCGQKLPKSRMDRARKTFEADRDRQLDAIKARAEEVKSRIAKAQGRLETANEDYVELIDTLSARHTEMEAIPAPVPPTDMPDYASRRAAVSEKISEVEQLIRDAQGKAKKPEADLRAKIQGTRQDIAQIDSAIAQEARLMAARQRVDELMEQARKASEALENLDAMLFLIEDFSRYKAHFVEDSINGLFEHATFRLFKEQINGGLEECCDVVYKGVPYNSLNNGARINIGIDIIKTISTRTGVSVPLFVDNAEAVTDLWDSGSQQIRLVVAESAKELTIR